MAPHARLSDLDLLRAVNMAWFSAYDLFDAIGHFKTAQTHHTGQIDMRHAFFEGVDRVGAGRYAIGWGS